jgi:hypothetical protein
LINGVGALITGVETLGAGALTIGTIWAGTVGIDGDGIAGASKIQWLFTDHTIMLESIGLEEITDLLEVHIEQTLQ